MAEVAMDIASFIAQLALAQRSQETALSRALERAARVVEAEAKGEIGTYQPEHSPFLEWAELADSTKAERERLGFEPDEPLLRTGELRDSIGHTVEVNGRDGEAQIGSNSEIAVYQEVGTARIPPRSFLGGALVARGEDVVRILGEDVVGSLFGEGVTGGRIPVPLPPKP